MIVHIPLHYIMANPWQPRLHQDPERIEELRQSIVDHYPVLPALQRGLLQIPLARITDLDGVALTGPGTHSWVLERVEEVKAGEALTQLVFGHSRFAAFQLLANGDGSDREPDDRFAEFPVEIVQLSDQQMAEDAFTENTKRQDLSWFEVAATLNRFKVQFGYTLEGLAAKFDLGTYGNVAGYLRAYEALKAFNSVDLLHAAETGELPLKHTLTLIPLLRENNVGARQWIAQGGLVDQNGEIRSAAEIRDDVDQLLGRERPAPVPQPQPASPSDESQLDWWDHYDRVCKQHPGEAVFMALERAPWIWIAIRQNAAIVANKLGARGSFTNVGGHQVSAVKITAPAQTHPADLEASLEANLGKIHWYLEPSDALEKAASFLPETRSIADAEPVGKPSVPSSAPAQPSSAKPGNGAPAYPGLPASQPAPAPLSEEERQAAVRSRMETMFPGARPQNPWEARAAELGVEVPDAPANGDHDTLLASFRTASQMLNDALMLINSLPDVVEAGDRVIAEHLRGSADHTLKVFGQMVETVADADTLAGLRDQIASSEQPEKVMRDFMAELALAQSRADRTKVEALND